MDEILHVSSQAKKFTYGAFWFTIWEQWATKMRRCFRSRLELKFFSGGNKSPDSRTEPETAITPLPPSPAPVTPVLENAKPRTIRVTIETCFVITYITLAACYLTSDFNIDIQNIST